MTCAQTEPAPEMWGYTGRQFPEVYVVCGDVNEISGNDRMGLFPHAECPDANTSGVFRWRLCAFKRPCMRKNWSPRVSVLRNGRG